MDAMALLSKGKEIPAGLVVTAEGYVTVTHPQTLISTVIKHLLPANATVKEMHAATKNDLLWGGFSILDPMAIICTPEGSNERCIVLIEYGMFPVFEATHHIHQVYLQFDENTWYHFCFPDPVKYHCQAVRSTASSSPI